MRTRRVFAHMLQATVVALLVASLAVSSVAAAKPSAGGKGGKPASGTATLLVTPNPVASGGATYTVTGSGYAPGLLVGVAIANPGCCLAFNVAADSTGAIRFQATTGRAGTYTVTTKKYGTSTVLAQKRFEVQ